MWPFTLSGRLCIIALVGRCPANQLMHRRSIRCPGCCLFQEFKMPRILLWGFVFRFQKVSPGCGQVPYVLLTRSPLGIRRCLVRLACIRHAASVHPEPGSNSPFDIDSFLFLLSLFFLFRCFSRNRRVILVLSYLYVFSSKTIRFCQVFKDRPSLPFPTANEY